jgi:mannitol/fructose-specific phosphotransferase system IIA component (Ntr-type)
LKTLARVSRLLRNRAFRDRLVSASGAEEAYGLIVAEEGERP